jgi:hypothetical protein
LTLAWQLDANWKYDPEFVTELEMRFTPDAGGTRVELEHRNLEKYGEKAADVRAALDSIGGWNGAIAAFVRLIETDDP